MIDCAFERGNCCMALKEKNCRCCPFWKSKAQLEDGRKKARNRIRRLPEVKQKHIKEKYNECLRKMEND